MDRRRVGVTSGLLAFLVLVAGCVQSGERPTPTAQDISRRTNPQELLIGSGTVLDSRSGPEFCVGVVWATDPPQCDGLTLIGWGWPRQGTENTGGVRWGEFTLVGTYDGASFTYRRLATKAEIPSTPTEDEATGGPCPEPRGGWVSPRPARTTESDLSRATAEAYGLPGYTDSWVDTGDNSRSLEDQILAVRVTKNVPRARRQLGRIWGGPLCVTRSRHTSDNLGNISDTVSATPGYLIGGANEGWVDAQFVYDDGTLQRRFDKRYGAGMVVISTTLHPLRTS
jgi:hypothetical protein